MRKILRKLVDYCKTSPNFIIVGIKYRPGSIGLYLFNFLPLLVVRKTTD